MNNYAEELVPTTVVDNFFETPSLVRNLALHQDYWKCTEHPNGGNWPGKRTRYINEIDPVFHEIVCKKLIRYLPHHVAFEIADMTFHISDAINSPGWIHTDPPHLGIGGVIYLNEGIKQSTGTCLYDVPSGFNGQGYEEEFQQQLALQGTPEASKFEKYKDECNGVFRPSVTVEARYNRCVIFDGRKYHGGMNFYGSNVDDARLTIVFFGRGILSGV